MADPALMTTAHLYLVQLGFVAAVAFWLARRLGPLLPAHRLTEALTSSERSGPMARRG